MRKVRDITKGPRFPKLLSVGALAKGSLTRMTGPLTEALCEREASAGGRIPHLLGAKRRRDCEISSFAFIKSCTGALAHHAEPLL